MSQMYCRTEIKMSRWKLLRFSSSTSSVCCHLQATPVHCYRGGAFAPRLPNQLYYELYGLSSFRLPVLPADVPYCLAQCGPQWTVIKLCTGSADRCACLQRDLFLQIKKRGLISGLFNQNVSWFTVTTTAGEGSGKSEIDCLVHTGETKKHQKNWLISCPPHYIYKTPLHSRSSFLPLFFSRLSMLFEGFAALAAGSLSADVLKVMMS